MGRGLKKLELLLLVLIFSPVMVAAIAKQDSQPWVGALIVGVSIMILLIVFIVAFLIHHYGHGCLGTATDNPQRHQEVAHGLDALAIAALPTLQFSEIKNHRVGQGELECAVCLHEFVDKETLSLLPNCSHMFHLHCIKPWLTSHVTCPVCRANLECAEGSSVSKSDILDQISGALQYGYGDHIMVAIEGSSSEVNQITHGKTISKMSSTNGGLFRCHSMGHLQVRVKGGNMRPNLCTAWPNESSPKSDYQANNIQANLNRWGCFATAPASPYHTPRYGS